MHSFDTNILFYASNKESKYYQAANDLMNSFADDSSVVLAELVLVELYLLIRNPAVMEIPLSEKEAYLFISSYRKHPSWRLVENAPIMDEVWELAKSKDFPRRRVFDLRLALTLKYHGVKVFYTVNNKNFDQAGFSEVRALQK